MYNRYIPQPDGSYARNRVPDHNPQRHRSNPSPPPQIHCDTKDSHIQDNPPPRKHTEHNAGFLRQLLPKDFDTGDLIVILLLLLMAGDSEEDRNNAILTIALYFLM